MPGLFITFEGGEGAGKSTQIRLLAEKLRHDGLQIVLTREPGGSTGAEATRHVLLSGAAEQFGPEMEAILFAAARNDHVEQVIRPAVQAGSIVLCDRFMDSSRVYQGVTGQLNANFMKNLERVAIGGMVPDITIVLDIDPAIGLKRAASRGVAADRYEKEDISLHQSRRDAFLAIAKAEPERCLVVDAVAPEDEIASKILGAVRAKMLASAA